MKALGIFVAVALAVAAFAAGARAATNPSPRTAAHAARACFVKMGWSARFTDGGIGLIAKAPRVRPNNGGIWPHPWYSVTFNLAPYFEGQKPTTYPLEMRYKLNAKENRTATFCRRAGWR